jgi:hypothetical protein
MIITVGFSKTWVKTLGSQFLPVAFFHSLPTVMESFNATELYLPTALLTL